MITKSAKVETVGYTQEKVAEELGVDRTTVVRWERAESEPQPWQRPRLAALLKVSPEELHDILLDVITMSDRRAGEDAGGEAVDQPEVQATRVATEGNAPLSRNTVTSSAGTLDGTAGLPGTDRVAREFGDKLALIMKVTDVALDEARSIARSADNVIELDLDLSIDIGGDGRASLVYRHTVVNIGARPVTRLAREVWFKHAEPPIMIEPVTVGDTRMVIKRLHDTPTLVKFACQLSPALQPGAPATVQYTVTGGRFVDEFYWRQATPRYVRRLTILVRHKGAGRLRDCTAVEEHPDGSENSAAEQLRWDYEGSDLVVTLTRDHLRPNQAVTLRWEPDREPAGRD
ncbi:helix-turn-helix transcriptional regulator [Luedemannella flava]